MSGINDVASRDNPIFIAQHLQLLHQFGYSDPNILYEGVFYRDRNNKWNRDALTAVRVLDAITLTLMTDRPGEAFAAAFDNRHKLTLVLAKDSPVTDEDDQIVRELIQTIAASSTKYAIDVYPFLLSRCRKSIEKQARKILKAVDQFSPDIDAVLKEHKYTPQPTLEAEFPKSEIYRHARYENGAEPLFSEMLHGLLEDLRGVIASVATLDGEDAKINFMLLVDAVSMLSHCHFLAWACTITLSEWHGRAVKLRCRLLRFRHYIQGITTLMKEKCFLQNGIEYRWLDPIATHSGEQTLFLPDECLNVVSSALGFIPSDSDQEKLHKQRSEWSHSVETRLHVEIRLLLQLVDLSVGPVPLGCSRRTCLCCTLWIKAYNREFCADWLTSDPSGKARVDWALPGCPGKKHENIVKAVRNGVRLRCIDEVDWFLFPTESKYSHD
ncbi:hypothetical protein F5I97DRAFT_1831622 [Phlebopus sp. FC_14]|nr:hypothetical protein F5I97DRAFT_1831622 [Phlebopus sp. FC_14]